MEKTIRENYYEIAVSDFDGTLFSQTAGINRKTLESIDEFIKAGGTFCVCTGRMTSSIVKFYKEYGFKGYVISFNGAEISDSETGEKVFKKHVDNATCIKLLEYAEKNGKRVQVYPNDVLTVEKVNDDYRAYAARCHVELCETGCRVSEVFKKTGNTSGKVLFYTDDLCRAEMYKEISAIAGDSYEVVCSNPEHIDVMAKGVSKGNAALKLCEMLKKDRKKMICFGDEMNDLSMIEIAGLGVATANGSELLKSRADIVVPSCEDGGVGIAIEKYCIRR